MAIGRPIEQTPNIADKVVTATATAGQTQFTVDGGYRINHLAVFRNGVRLVNGNDYTALDGTTITLMEDASNLDVLEFQVFDTFNVSDALLTNAASQTVNGDVTVNGTFTVGSGGIGTFTAAEVVVGIVSSTTGITTVQSLQASSSTTTGALVVKGGVGIGKSLHVGGNISVGGTLTYEDVTNVDSVGVVTAGKGVRITTGGLVVTAGVSTFAGITTVTNTAALHSKQLNVSAGSTFGGAVTASDTLTVAGNVDIADKIIHTGDTNTAIRFPAADTVTVETAGTERVRVSSAGSFAIGDATEPGAKLYVNGVSSNDIITARAADTNGNSIINIIAEGTQGNSRITFADTAGVDGWVSYNHSSRQVNFAAGGTSPQVHVNRTGELLVGTATTFGSDSARKLQLENDSTGPVIALKTDNNNPNADTFFGGLENISECNGVNTINSAIYFDADGNHSGSNGPGRIELHTNSGNSLLERVRVDSNGYVGIKITDPHLYYSKDLVVQAIAQGGITVKSANTTDTNYLMFADGTSGNERYRGYIGYAHNTGSDNGEHMQFAASGGTGLMRFYADGLALSGETATANRLNDYEEGDFTPTLGHSHTAAEADGKYTKVGNMCIAAMSITLPTTSNANHLVLGSLPFTAAGGRPGSAILRYSNSGTAYLIAWHVNAGESSVAPYYGNGGSVVTYAEQSAKRFDLTFVYRTA